MAKPVDFDGPAQIPDLDADAHCFAGKARREVGDVLMKNRQCNLRDTQAF